MKGSYIPDHAMLKTFFDNHAVEGKYFNAFFKCDNDECICGKVHSPPEIFQKMRDEGILRPVLSSTSGQTKYLSYEEIVNHPRRQEERLPSNHNRVVEPPPFTLSTKRSRFAIKCSNEDCCKSRVVFTEIKPSPKDVKLCKEKIDESTYVCGDRVDVLRKFACNERIHCTDDIETVYYSGLADMALEDVICYGCGVKLSSEYMGKYIEEKAMHSQVFPTCGKERCTKFNTKLFMSKRARKVDKKWKEEQRMRKRQKAMKLMEDAVQEVDDMDLDLDE